jgi:hypothetical protein
MNRFKMCQFYDEIVKQNLPSFDEDTKKFAQDAFVELKYPKSREVLIYDIFRYVSDVFLNISSASILLFIYCVFLLLIK